MKGICYVVLIGAAPFLAQAATPSVCNPYTFIGRVMDAKHDAFGSNRVAKIAAASPICRVMRSMIPNTVA